MSLYIENEYLKCKNCNLNIKVSLLPKKYDLLKIKHACQIKAPYNGSQKVGIIKKGINYTKAVVTHVKKGMKPCPEKLHLIRLEVCNLCRHGDNNECFICGCSIPIKASWASSTCPVYKWPRTMNDLLLFGKDKPANLGNKFLNAGCFFIGSGPSLEKLNLSLLKERGVLSFAVNNVAAFSQIRPNFWLSCDDPSSFHKVIWKDPGIMKFVRRPNYDKIETPLNCYYFDINEDFMPQTFFTEPTVCFGNKSDLIDEFGGKGGRSVMYCSFRIMHHLGIRRIYLIGCDFNMDEKRPYVFDQKKWGGGCRTNNQHYEIMNTRFKSLNTESKKHGLTIYNCTPNSGLTAFEELDYYKAIQREKLDTPDSLAGMYGGSDKVNG